MKKLFRFPSMCLVLLLFVLLSCTDGYFWLFNLGLVLVGYLAILFINQLWLQIRNNYLYTKHREVSKLINRVKLQ